MNFKSFIALGVSFSTAVGIAQEAKPEANYPYIAPACNFQVNMPKNSPGYFRNKDCRVIHVTPESQGSVKLHPGKYGMAVKLCPTVNDQMVTLQSISAHIRELQEKIRALAVTDPLYDKVSDALAKAMDRKKSFTMEYGNYFGMSLQMDIIQPSLASAIENYAELNPVLVEAGVSFEPTPVEQSLLAFSSASGDSQEYPVMKAKIPGVTVVGEDQQEFVLGTGPKSAHLALNLMGTCPTLKNGIVPQDLSTAVPDTKGLSANLVANVTHRLPVKSLLAYTAKLNQERFLALFHERNELKGQFNVTQFTNQLKDSELKELMSFEIEAYEEEAELSDADRERFKNELRRNLFQEMFNQAMSILKDMNLAETFTGGPTVAAPNGGNVPQKIGTIRHCRREVGPFGLWVGNEHCWNSDWIIQVWRDGSSQQEDVKRAFVSADIGREIKEDKVVYRHTSTIFSPSEE